MLMDPGTGKTKVIYDSAGYHALQGTINTLITLAPNGVHRNWITDEAPTHFTDAVPYAAMFWRTDSASTKDYQRDFAKLIGRSDRFVIFAANIESMITDRLTSAIKEIIKRRGKVMFVVDESSDIKTPGAARTKRVLNLSRLPGVLYRRALDGTMATENPFEVYSQFKFIDPTIFNCTFAEFKSEYGIWERKGRDPEAYRQLKLLQVGDLEESERRAIEKNLRGRTYPSLKEHRNLDKLRKIISQHSFRITKEAALPHLPPKQYTKLPFDLSREQRRMYDELREQFITSFADGSTVTAAMRLTRDLRLQQISCGYVPVDPDPTRSDDVEPVRRIPGPQPRIEMLERAIGLYPGKMIIWCRFSEDINAIMRLLGSKAVRCDGRVSADERADSMDRFQRGDALWFVANPKAAGRGYTLTAAQYMLFYSSYFSLRLRLQSEDRNHRAGLLHENILYIDPYAVNSVDERILKSHRDKKEMADTLTGDPRRDWI